ncbi:MAG: VCBS repeat-containing protein, partial [bacterium]
MKIVQIEERSRRVAEILSSAASSRSKLRAVVRFFEKAGAHADTELLRSYYLQFATAVLHNVNDSTLQHTDPQYQRQAIALLKTIQKHFPDAVDPDSLEQRLVLARKVLTETWFILGEWEKGLAELEEITGEHLPADERQRHTQETESQADPYDQLLIITSQLKDNHPRSYAICQEILDDWQHNFRSPHTDRMHILLVEKMNTLETTEEDAGVLLPISSKTRTRPKDAEEDIIKVNNEILPTQDAMHHSLMDAIAAARRIGESKQPKINTDTYFTFQFSLPEKRAQYSGDSWNAAVAIFSYAGMINAFHKQILANLSSSTVITGSIDQDGALSTVQEEGLKAKIKSVFFSPIKRLIVPWKNMSSAMTFLECLQRQYPNRHLILESAANLNQLVEDRNLVIQKRLTLPRQVVAGARRNKQMLGWIAFVLMAIVIIAGFILKGYIWKDRNPATFDIVGQHLVVKNVRGEELWRYNFGIPLTKRQYFGIYQNIILKDVDKDGKNELLFGIYENDFPDKSGYMFLFNDDGRVLFKKKTGQEMTFGGKIYSDHYRIAFVDAVDLDNNGQNEIVSISYQYPYFPCCVNVWNLQGEKLGEYWHAGQFQRLDCFDLDGDGVKEIFALGQNNEYRCAV